jgi:hypothetical protein
MNQKYSNIRVLVGRSQDAVENNSCDDVRECDTAAEAKKFARYSLTPAYQASGEFTTPMGYAKVVADENGSEVCLADYFSK